MGSMAMMGAGLVLNLVGGFMQQSQAKAAAKLQEQAAQLEYDQATKTAHENLKLQYEEQVRQQTEVNRKAGDQKRDLARRTDAELAALTVALGETGGAAGSTSGERLMIDQEYVGGLDVSRVEGNRKALIDSIEADKKAAIQDQQNAINRAGMTYAISKAEARLRASQAKVDSFIGTLSSGVKIISQGYSQYAQVQIAKGSS